MRLQVCILTPNRIFQDEEIEELILPTSTGQIGILKGHSPLITAIDIGPIMFRKESNWTAAALIGGFALVQENKVTILVNDAVRASSVKLDQAEKDLEEATRHINQVVGEKEKVEAVLSFKRARVKYQIIQWKKLGNSHFL